MPQQRRQLRRPDPDVAAHQQPAQLLAPVRVEPGRPRRLDPPLQRLDARDTAAAAKERLAHPRRRAGRDQQVGRHRLAPAVAAPPPAVLDAAGGVVADRSRDVGARAPLGRGGQLLVLAPQRAREEGDRVSRSPVSFQRGEAGRAGRGRPPGARRRRRRRRRRGRSRTRGRRAPPRGRLVALFVLQGVG